MKRESAWKKYTDQELITLEKLAEDYKAFISENKTERECCKTAVELAEKHGYVSLQKLIGEGKKLTAGSKVWATSQNKMRSVYIYPKMFSSSGFCLLYLST